MPSLKTTALDLANHTKSGVWQKAIRSGVLSQLAVADPEIKTGSTDVFTFTSTPKAELVGEGGQKSSMDGTPTKATVKTYKVQITYRVSNEVEWADEDYQIGLVDTLIGRTATALSRALDLLAIHGINPATGVVSANVSDYLDKHLTDIGVTTTASPTDDVKAMATKLTNNGYMATGIAFDPTFAMALAQDKDTTNRPLYPELGLGFGFSNFQGLTAAAADTISGRAEMAAADALDQAIMGDFNAFSWGVAREVPLELIPFGDPDGQGDLKRTNEVAIRAEAVLGFAFMDVKAFAVASKPSA